MNAVKAIAIVLIVAGLLSATHGGFSYTREIHKTRNTNSGSLEVSIQNTQTLSVPIWASIGAIIAGGLLLILPNRKN
ncbi:hypothetical protein [Candidatus Methylobacter oryzae]|uniref:Uncharacterized protein n=1 Tax=Candidatus Methylobacter oryzae TaxID=2497749 RepID=A0ABY3CDX9_9GAMM|nr:hypothetical protein [Candidatus Methylobacter oryzae]TRX00921.1 hypothetical protein EKO24_004795 [Candidatus Methylobacter oryzae]